MLYVPWKLLTLKIITYISKVFKRPWLIQQDNDPNQLLKKERTEVLQWSSKHPDLILTEILLWDLSFICNKK